jgi:hypothetical protein
VSLHLAFAGKNPGRSLLIMCDERGLPNAQRALYVQARTPATQLIGIEGSSIHAGEPLSIYLNRLLLLRQRAALTVVKFARPHEVQVVDLSWSPVTSANVDIYRDRVVIAAAATMAFVAANSFSLSVPGRSNAKSQATGNWNRARFQWRPICVERLGCFEIATWLDYMLGGEHGSAERRSCRCHDRAKRTKTACRNAWPRSLPSNSAVTFHRWSGRDR